MMNLIRIFVVFAVCCFCTCHAAATVLGGVAQAALLPANPTSLDSLKLSITNRACGGIVPYVGNIYSVAMSQNQITVKMTKHLPNAIVPLCPGGPREEFDLGRLPSGRYTLTLIEDPTGTSPTKLLDGVVFDVTDGRATKTAPWVRLDYSGHWWDPNDSGWGLFIWHDARDNVLAAWFTYTAEGKPAWYVFQPKWQTDSSTLTADLIQTSRLPGLTSPPPNPTILTTVGTASLDFRNFGTSDEGTLSYKLGNGTTQNRKIQRFKS